MVIGTQTLGGQLEHAAGGLTMVFNEQVLPSVITNVLLPLLINPAGIGTLAEP